MTDQPDLGVELGRLAALIDAGCDVGCWPSPVALSAAVDQLAAASVDDPSDLALMYLRIAAGALLSASKARTVGGDHEASFTVFAAFVALLGDELNDE